MTTLFADDNSRPRAALRQGVGFVTRDEGTGTAHGEREVKCVRCGFTFAILICPPMCSVCWDAVFRNRRGE